MNDQSGQTYLYNGFRISILPYFLYEICISKYWKDRYCVIGTKFYKSNKPLTIKNYRIFKRYEDHIIEKTISLLAVPNSFIEENNIQTYTTKKKNGKNDRRKSRSITRSHH